VYNCHDSRAYGLDGEGNGFDLTCVESYDL
jgi:hypothetical protein